MDSSFGPDFEWDFEGNFLDYFSDIEDSRKDWNKRYSAIEILFLAFCAVLCGASSWRYIEEYGKSKLDLLRKFFPYEHGTPSDDTVRRFFRALNPEEFQRTFVNWIGSYFSDLREQIIAIDGKASCGSVNIVNKEKSMLHMVSAYATELNLILTQQKVADKSNEITAIPQILESLDLRGATVTIDAMGCQYKIADQIINQKGKYVLALKGNQESIHEDVITAFSDQEMLKKCDVFENFDKGHGRIETRKCFVLEDVKWLREMYPNWQTIKAIVRVDSKREIKDKITEETRYYIASEVCNAEKMLHIIRSHWSIENSVHWILDMTFGEDQSRIRKGNAPQNMAILRHLILNLLQIAKKKFYPKESIKGLKLKAMWSDNILLTVLNQKKS
jgi:predicted transposase YbfD/YdcC